MLSLFVFFCCVCAAWLLKRASKKYAIPDPIFPYVCAQYSCVMVSFIIVPRIKWTIFFSLFFVGIVVQSVSLQNINYVNCVRQAVDAASCMCGSCALCGCARAIWPFRSINIHFYYFWNIHRMTPTQCIHENMFALSNEHKLRIPRSGRSSAHCAADIRNFWPNIYTVFPVVKLLILLFTLSSQHIPISEPSKQTKIAKRPEKSKPDRNSV